LPTSISSASDSQDRQKFYLRRTVNHPGGEVHRRLRAACLKASLTRVCHPSPVARKRATTSRSILTRRHKATRRYHAQNPKSALAVILPCVFKGQRRFPIQMHHEVKRKPPRSYVVQVLGQVELYTHYLIVATKQFSPTRVKSAGSAGESGSGNMWYPGTHEGIRKFQRREIPVKSWWFPPTLLSVKPVITPRNTSYSLNEKTSRRPGVLVR